MLRSVDWCYNNCLSSGKFYLFIRDRRAEGNSLKCDCDTSSSDTFYATPDRCNWNCFSPTNSDDCGGGNYSQGGSPYYPYTYYPISMS